MAAKGWMVADTLGTGVSVNGLAVLHASKANHRSAWFALARHGKPVAPQIAGLIDNNEALELAFGGLHINDVPVCANARAPNSSVLIRVPDAPAKRLACGGLTFANGNYPPTARSNARR